MRYLFSFLSLSLLVLFLSAFFNPPKETDYEKHWVEVENLLKKGLPKSALQHVDEIYAAAKGSGNEEQSIKALIYIVKLKSQYEEDVLIKAIKRYEKELEIASPTEASLLQTLIAELYQNYFTNNRWAIYDRAQIFDDPSEDISSWDAVHFQKTIGKYYLESVSQTELLQGIELKSFADILVEKDASDFSLWPSLYDLLAQRAIQYYSERDPLSQSEFSFSEKDSLLFASPKVFVGMDLSTYDNEQASVKTLKLFQQLTKLHLHKNQTEALVDLELRRLQFLRNHSSSSEFSKKKYEESLEKLLEIYQSEAVSVPISIDLASSLVESRISGETRSEKSEAASRGLKALELFEDAVKNFPEHPGINICKNAIAEIKHPYFDFQVASVVLPEQPILSLIRYKHTTKLFFKIVALDPEEVYKKRNMRQYLEGMQEFLKKEAIVSWEQELPAVSDYLRHSTEIALPELPLGYYAVYVSSDPEFGKETPMGFQLLWVSRLSYLSKENPKTGQVEMYVLDRESGKPISGVDMEVYSYEYKGRERRRQREFVGSYQTNTEGYVALESFGNQNRGRYQIIIKKAEDRYDSEDYMSFWKNDHSPTVNKTHFFTDRAIYRPGQTVHFKGIMTRKTGDENQLRTDMPTEVEFLDANRKMVSKSNFISNDYGSFHGSFVIPLGSLNGRMTIKNESSSIGFMVESYKRPTFQVTFDSIDTQYKLGETIDITGRAEDFAGSAVSDARVSYRITRMAHIPQPYYRRSVYIPWPLLNREIEIDHGLSTTRTDGSFPLSFMALAQPGIAADLDALYTFKIYVEISDITGEVQVTQTRIQVGATALQLAINLPDQSMIDRENTSGIQLSATNYSGLPQNVSAKLTLFKLSPPDRLLKNRSWEEPDIYSLSKEAFNELFPHIPYKDELEKENWPKTKISSTSFSFTGKQWVFQDELKTLDPGVYQLRLETTNDFGEETSTEAFFTLYSSQSKKPAGNPVFWASLNKTKAEPGETVQLLVGSMAKKSHMVYEIYSGDVHPRRQWVSLNRNQKTIDIPITEADRGNIYVLVHMVRFNQIYSKEFVIHVPFTNKKLDISIETFRDHLSPGMEEEWRITLKDYQGAHPATEVLTAMYDASLDQFVENQWSMHLFQAKHSPNGFHGQGFSTLLSQKMYEQWVKQLPVERKTYPSIESFYSQRGYVRGAHGTPEIFVDGISLEMVDNEAASTKEELNVKTSDANAMGSSVVEEEIPEPMVSAPLRSNFQETAFFYPQLKTDEKGQLVFSFTTPDALTEWKLMVLAHNAALQTGMLEKKIKSSKPLMVMPHAPLYVRQGDQLDFSAKVVNFTDTSMKVNVWIEFYDPLSNKGLHIFSKPQAKSIPVQLKAKENTQLSWRIIIPDSLSMLAYRIKAVGADFTDGEERAIPVLTNRMLVTETIPIFVNANETRQFHFDGLIQTGKFMGLVSRKDYRYTLEFTSNPAWYAIQALPVLNMPTYESVDNLFRVYYSNSLSSFIINSQPHIQQVFESWKSTSPEAFYSNLQKNESLKSALLKATPWVLEAESESEQKRRIGVLFDLNRLAGEKSAVLSKLQKAQLASGAWPWFKGGRENTHITQSVVIGLAKLSDKSVINLQEDASLKAMLRRAVKYLDKDLREEYNLLLKTEGKKLEKHQLSASRIQYLYARTLLLDDIPLASASKQAFSFYEKQMKKYWLKHSNLLQAMSALSLYKLGHRNEAEAIIRSLTERSLQDEEMGMYWKNNTSWYWYQAPVETQAIIIEAFNTIQRDSRAVELMKIWLLKQKQTTSWNNGAATADAIFSLLFSGQNMLSETQMPDISVGGTKLDVSQSSDLQAEAGSGYFKTTWSSSQITPELGDISVSNPNPQLSWGAAYWQYFEDLDKISSAQSPLSIDKKLYREVQNDEGPVLHELSEGQALKTGDKIMVRLIITSDRTMEYVHLSDMRATAFEALSITSGHHYSAGLSYYINKTDVATDFFIRYLNKGSYVLEYPVYVTQSGNFTNGIASIQCLYAPEFAAHSKGFRVEVE